MNGIWRFYATHADTEEYEQGRLSGLFGSRAALRMRARTAARVGMSIQTPLGFLRMSSRYAHLRHRADAAEGMTYARARDVQSSNPHQVVVPLDDRAALEEALSLLRKAYDDAN